MGPVFGPMTAFRAVFAVMGPPIGPMTAVHPPRVARIRQEVEKILYLCALFTGTYRYKPPILSMKVIDKITYMAPSTQVFEVKTECVVCASPALSSVQNYTWHNEEEE